MQLTPGLRRYVLWMAHLALVIYIAQIVAIDHWGADPAETASVPNSNAHALHCHGTSSCADGASLSTAMLKPAVSPLPPEPRVYTLTPAVPQPNEALIETPLEPPRAA